MSHFDGHPSQAGVENAHLVGVKTPFSLAELREGVVIEVFYKDEVYNRSRKYAEYEVRDVLNGEIYTKCRRLQSTGGSTDGGEDILQAATKSLEAGVPFNQLATPARYMDGDRVLVGFVGGSSASPVIVGVLPHTASDYGATRADGQRRFLTHRGTAITMGDDGKWSISRGDTSITLNPDETVVLTHKSGTVISILDNGDVAIVQAGNLLLGDAGLSAPGDGVVHGTGVDPFTGSTYAVLNNACATVLAKK
jgi:hypothetical protein